MEITRSNYQYQLEIGDNLKDTSIYFKDLYNEKSLIKRSFDNDGLFSFTVLEKMEDNCSEQLFGSPIVDNYIKKCSTGIDWLEFAGAKIFTTMLCQICNANGLSKLNKIKRKKLFRKPSFNKSLKDITIFSDKWKK